MVITQWYAYTHLQYIWLYIHANIQTYTMAGTYLLTG